MGFIILAAVAVLLLAAAVFTGSLLTGMTSMVINKHGKKISVLRISLLGKKKFSNTIDAMHHRSREVFRRWLKLDFIFMLFVYPLMSSIAVLTGWSGRFAFSHDLLLLLVLLPLFTGLSDVLENIYTLFALDPGEDEKKNTVYPMMLFSLLKWISLAVWLVSLLYGLFSFRIT